MDAKTEELRAAHDVLAEFYAGRLADALDRMPAERAVLGLFCESVRAAGLGTSVGDIGCGTGRLEPYLAARGLYWLAPDEMESRVADAGFATVFWGGRPAQGQEGSPQGYLLAQKS